MSLSKPRTLSDNGKKYWITSLQGFMGPLILLKYGSSGEHVDWGDVFEIPRDLKSLPRYYVECYYLVI